MTKIQLRRDTASNWSTNNPTPSVGEPCFETDTGKLKIGDGSTAYNDLAYQGGGSIPANMVTTDTKQIISGLKTFVNDINLNQWTSGGSHVRETHIDLSSGGMNEYISASGTDKSFGLYCNSDLGIQVGTSKTDFTQGLTVKPNSLTFKNSDGTTTDLLAGGDIPVASDTTLGGVKIGNSVTLDGDNKLGINSEVTLTNDIRNTNTATYNLGLGSYTTEKYSPLIKYDKDNHTVTARMTDRKSVNGFTSYDNPVDVTMMAKSFKVGDVTNQYDVVTKSPTNNEYMAHMAMPSDKFIDLDLGASGTTYTAPADGYAYFNTESASNVARSATIENKTSGYMITTTDGVGSALRILLPLKKNDTFEIRYNILGSSTTVKFIYAVGSEPSS